jgi:cytochrome c556
MRGIATRKYLAAATVAASCLAAPASASSVNATDESTIDYRKNIMKTKGDQAAAIGQVLALMVPADNLISHFETLLHATRQSKVAFAPKVPGGDALPAVWENWADFSARLDKTEANLVKAIESARRTGAGPGGLGEDAIEAMNSCKECHDIYRAKK